MADQMPDDPRRRLRASDADRDRTAVLLSEHHAVGRLTAEEFDERLNKVFPAKTLAELDELLADLPAIDLYQLPAEGIRPAKGGGARRRGYGLERRPGRVGGQAAGWTGWTGIGSLSMLVWLGLAVTYSGLLWIPWFLLIVIPWTLVLVRRSPPGS
jgi:hypothetical protein